jgi:hypothetical protein
MAPIAFKNCSRGATLAVVPAGKSSTAQVHGTVCFFALRHREQGPSSYSPEHDLCFEKQFRHTTVPGIALGF